MTIQMPDPAHESGYGGRAFARASACATALRYGADDPREMLRALLALPRLLWYLLRLQQTTVEVTASLAGRMIAEHLSCRRWGLPRFRLAQGVLLLPDDLATYMRGRQRQALRTNLHHARKLGLRCARNRVEHWLPPGGGDRDLTRSAPTEHWRAIDRAGQCVGEAWVTVDEHVALLHGLGSSRHYARWLLHTAIVEHLVSRGCRLLLTNSHDAPLLPAGAQHFQHLLGYSVARLRVRVPRRAATPLERLRTVCLGATACAAIVASHLVTTPFRLPGYRAMVWLTALVALRLACARAGVATVVAAVAGLSILALGLTASALVPLTYLLCGAAVDISLSLFPHLARRKLTMSLLGCGVMFLTFAAPHFPTLGHIHPYHGALVPPAIGAAICGAAAGVLGRLVGTSRLLRRRLAAGL